MIYTSTERWASPTPWTGTTVGFTVTRWSATVTTMEAAGEADVEVEVGDEETKLLEGDT